VRLFTTLTALRSVCGFFLFQHLCSPLLGEESQAATLAFCFFLQELLPGEEADDLRGDLTRRGIYFPKASGLCSCLSTPVHHQLNCSAKKFRGRFRGIMEDRFITLPDA